MLAVAFAIGVLAHVLGLGICGDEVAAEVARHHEVRVAGIRDVGGRLGHLHAGDQFADQAFQVGPVGVLLSNAGFAG